MPMQRIVEIELRNKRDELVKVQMLDPMGVIMTSLEDLETFNDLVQGVPTMSSQIGQPMAGRYALTSPLFGPSAFELAGGHVRDTFNTLSCYPSNVFPFTFVFDSLSLIYNYCLHIFLWTACISWRHYRG